MPIVSIPQSVLFQKLQRDYSQEEFEDLCFQFGLELDEITSEKEIVAREKGKEKAKGCDTGLVYKIEIPANRYDLLCPEGLTRALMIFKQKLAIPTYVLEKSDQVIRLHVSSSTQAVRPFVVAAVLRNIKFDSSRLQSFIELQEKLHQNLCRKRSLVAIGTHDLDTLQPPFYYTTKPPCEIRFIPLNQDKSYTGEELMKLYSTDSHLKQYLPLIQNKSEYPVIYDSIGTILSMPPIINGNHSKITVETKNVFIEATATDLQKAIIVLDTLVTMFSEYCEKPFSIHTVEVIQHNNTRHIYPRLNHHHEVISIDYVNRLLGTKLSENEIISLLNCMGLKAEKVSLPSANSEINSSSISNPSGLLSVLIPPTRHDILHACDIAEDIAIAYGYNQIPEHLPQTYCLAGTQPLNRLTDLIRAEIAQLGFTEVLSFSLCSKDDVSKKLRHDLNTISAVQISNPKSIDFQVVRTSLLPGILQTISNNRKLPIPLKLFEVQDIVLKDSSKDVGARNRRRICAVYYNKNSGFEIIHGLLDRLMQLLQIEPNVQHSQSGDLCMNNKQTYYIKPTCDPTYFPGRCADIILNPNNEIIGRFGVIHPDVIKNFDLSLPCSVLDLDLEIFV